MKAKDVICYQYLQLRIWCYWYLLLKICTYFVDFLHCLHHITQTTRGVKRLPEFSLVWSSMSSAGRNMFAWGWPVSSCRTVWGELGVGDGDGLRLRFLHVRSPRIASIEWRGGQSNLRSSGPPLFPVRQPFDSGKVSGARGERSMLISTCIASKF